MKYMFAALVLLAFSATASAQLLDWDALDCIGKTYAGNSFENATIALPDAAVQILEGETVELIIEHPLLGEQPVHGIVENGQLREFDCGTIPNETMRIRAEIDTFERIAKADNPTREFKDARERGELQIDTPAFTSSVKMFFVNIALWFMG